ncbi:unnamed protein product, partial [Ectocarpus sp. 12 AP-2014]
VFCPRWDNRESAERDVWSRSVTRVACSPVHGAPRPRVLGCKEARGPAEDALCAGRCRGIWCRCFSVVEHTGVPRVPGRRHVHPNVGYVLPASIGTARFLPTGRAIILVLAALI